MRISTMHSTTGPSRDEVSASLDPLLYAAQTLSKDSTQMCIGSLKRENPIKFKENADHQLVLQHKQLMLEQARQALMGLLKDAEAFDNRVHQVYSILPCPSRSKRLPSLSEYGLLDSKQYFTQADSLEVAKRQISIPFLVNTLPLTSASPLAIGQHAFTQSQSSASTPHSFAMSSPRISAIHREAIHRCEHPGCIKSFPSRSRLQRHLIVHTDAKPFTCPETGCGKRFSRRDNMMQHNKSHRVFKANNKFK